MIDAQTGHCAGGDEFEKKLVGRIKNFRHFHANGREIVYVEKATVVDFLGSNPPVGQPIRLRVEQFIQFIETARVSGSPIDLDKRFLDRFLHLGRFLGATLETSLDDLFFPRPLLDSLRINVRPSR